MVSATKEKPRTISKLENIILLKNLVVTMPGSNIIVRRLKTRKTAWRGGKNRLPERFVAKRSDSINATDVIWIFFQKHLKRYLLQTPAGINSP